MQKKSDEDWVVNRKFTSANQLQVIEWGLNKSGVQQIT